MTINLPEGDVKYVSGQFCSPDGTDITGLTIELAVGTFEASGGNWATPDVRDPVLVEGVASCADVKLLVGATAYMPVAGSYWLWAKVTNGTETDVVRLTQVDIEYAEDALNLPHLCWDVDPACSAEQWSGFGSDVQQRSIAMAVSTLRRLSAYRVGGCPIKVRPCNKGCMDNYFATLGLRWLAGSYGSGPFFPSQNALGQWLNNGCSCINDCNCGALCQVELPRPVYSVTEVKLNGDVLPTTDYKLIDNKLTWVATDMDCPWPTCQDLTLADSEVGTFSVSYMNTIPPDDLAKYAAGVLAVEFAKACSGGKCRLPDGVTSVVRQGVSMSIENGLFSNGFTGIREVDSWIALINPNGLKMPPTVFSPDLRSAKVVR